MGRVAPIGHNRGTYRILVRRLEGKRSLGIPRRRWEYRIKIFLQEVGSRGVGWIDEAQCRYRCRALVNAVNKLRVP